MKKRLCLILAALMLLGALSACSPAAPSQTASPGGASKKPKSFVFGVYNFTKIDPSDNYNGWAPSATAWGRRSLSWTTT